jgi:DNA-binding response OmpR family regulator
LRVLLIDDDGELGEAIRDTLDQYGISLIQAVEPKEGMKLLGSTQFDVLLLDMILPEQDGMSVCYEIRTSSESYRHIPILALSARAELTDRVVALEAGIDDFVTKPFEVRELVARLRAISRIHRSPALTERPTRPAGLYLDPASLEGTFRGVRVTFTALEMRLLLALQSEKSCILDRHTLMARIGYGDQGDSSIIDTMVYRIRQKFRTEGASSDFIKSVRGRGYQIMDENR